MRQAISHTISMERSTESPEWVRKHLALVGCTTIDHPCELLSLREWLKWRWHSHDRSRPGDGHLFYFRVSDVDANGVTMISPPVASTPALAEVSMGLVSIGLF